MVTLRSPAGVSVRSWIYRTTGISIVMGNIDEEVAGGRTSSNPQILLGAEEGGLLSVEYVRRAMAGGEKGS